MVYVKGVVFDYLLNGEISENVFERDIEKILDEQDLSKTLFNDYSSKALNRCKPIMINGHKYEVDNNLIQLSAVFLLKKQESDMKQKRNS